MRMGVPKEIKVHEYRVGLTPEARKTVMEVRTNYISKTQPPAATMIGIDKLVQDDLLIEIEAVAHIDGAR